MEGNTSRGGRRNIQIVKVKGQFWDRDSRTHG